MRGNALRFVPWLDSAVFNPAEAMVSWLEPLHRQEFRFLVDKAPDGAVLTGNIVIYDGVFIIAEIALKVAVSNSAPLESESSVSTPATRYRKIFPLTLIATLML
jgi:hypothetical protein